MSLPSERLERVEGWGMASHGLSTVFRPTNTDGLCAAFTLARETGKTVGLRGAGRSYGDAALNTEGILLDLSRMNRILHWNPLSGEIVLEPGATVQQVWQHCIEDGWWPPVVSGTMFPTLGGALSMNIHGKNNYKVGPLGDSVTEFDLFLPNGETRTCSRTENTDLFLAAIGGFGMLGVFTRITLQMKRVYSGLLDVQAVAARNFDELFAKFEEHLPTSDYLVGWVDCFAEGKALGRGQIHRANYLAPGDDPLAAQTLRVTHQELPETLFGIVPKSILWRLMKPFVNNTGMKLINAAKYAASARHDGHFRQSHAGFAFLLDYVPHWKRAYEPGGLIQYQSFVPKEHAQRVFSEQLQLAQKANVVPYLGVFKRHRPDGFLMTHAVDGYSLALDFAVTPQKRGALLSLTAEMDRLVVDAGGRFYFAKDSALHRMSLRDAMGRERIDKFCQLKSQCDPENLLQTDLYRRLFVQDGGH